MTQSGNFVSNIAVAANRAGVGGITAVHAVRSGNNSIVAVTQSVGVISNVAVATDRAGVGGVTAVHAVRSGNNSIVAVTQSVGVISNVAVATDRAGVGGVTAVHAVGSGNNSIVAMTQSRLQFSTANGTDLSVLTVSISTGSVTQSSDVVRLVAITAIDTGVGGVAFLGTGGSGHDLVVLVLALGLHRRLVGEGGLLRHQNQGQLDVGISTQGSINGVGAIGAGHLQAAQSMSVAVHTGVVHDGVGNLAAESVGALQLRRQGSRETQALNNGIDSLVGGALQSGFQLGDGHLIQSILQRIGALTIQIGVDGVHQLSAASTRSVVGQDSADNHGIVAVVSQVEGEVSHKRALKAQAVSQRNVCRNAQLVADDNGIQLAQSLNHISLLVSRHVLTDEDADVGVLLILGGGQIQSEAVILGDVGDVGIESGVYQAVLNQSSTVFNSIRQSTKIGNVSHELRSEGSDAVQVDAINHLLQQDGGSTQRIGDVDEVHTIQGVTIHRQLGTTVVVHQQLGDQIQSHHLNGGGVQRQVIGAQIDIQVIAILIQSVDAVAHSVVLEVIAVLQIGGHVGSILTGGDIEVTGHLTGDRTAILSIQGAVQNGQSTLGIHVTVDGVAVEVQQHVVVNGDVAADVAEQDDDSIIGSVSDSLGSITAQSVLVGQAVGADIQHQSLVVDAAVLQGEGNSQIQAGILLSDHIGEIADLVGSLIQHHIEGIVVQHAAVLAALGGAGLRHVVEDVIHAVVQEVQQSLMVLYVEAGDGIVEAGLLHGVEEAVGADVVILEHGSDQTERILHDLSHVIGLQVVETNLTHRHQSGQHISISGIGDANDGVQSAILAVDVVVGDQLLSTGLNLLEHLALRIKVLISNVEGHVGAVVDIHTILQGADHQLAAQLVGLVDDHTVLQNDLVGSAVQIQLVNVAVSFNHIGQRIQTKTAVQQHVDQSLHVQFQLAVSVNTEQGAAVQTNVGDILDEAHQLRGESRGVQRAHLGGDTPHNGQIALGIGDGNQRHGQLVVGRQTGVAQNRVHLINESQQVSLVHIDQLAGDHQLAVGAEQSVDGLDGGAQSKVLQSTGANLYLATVNGINIFHTIIIGAGQGDGVGVADVQDLIGLAINLDGVGHGAQSADANQAVLAQSDVRLGQVDLSHVIAIVGDVGQQSLVHTTQSSSADDGIDLSESLGLVGLHHAVILVQHLNLHAVGGLAGSGGGQHLLHLDSAGNGVLRGGTLAGEDCQQVVDVSAVGIHQSVDRLQVGELQLLQHSLHLRAFALHTHLHQVLLHGSIVPDDGQVLLHQIDLVLDILGVLALVVVGQAAVLAHILSEVVIQEGVTGVGVDRQIGQLFQSGLSRGGQRHSGGNGAQQSAVHTTQVVVEVVLLAQGVQSGLLERNVGSQHVGQVDQIGHHSGIQAVNLQLIHRLHAGEQLVTDEGADVSAVAIVSQREGGTGTIRQHGICLHGHPSGVVVQQAGAHGLSGQGVEVAVNLHLGQLIVAVGSAEEQGVHQQSATGQDSLLLSAQVSAGHHAGGNNLSQGLSGKSLTLGAADVDVLHDAHDGVLEVRHAINLVLVGLGQLGGARQAPVVTVGNHDGGTPGLVDGVGLGNVGDGDVNVAGQVTQLDHITGTIGNSNNAVVVGLTHVIVAVPVVQGGSLNATSVDGGPNVGGSGVFIHGEVLAVHVQSHGLNGIHGVLSNNVRLHVHEDGILIHHSGDNGGGGEQLVQNLHVVVLGDLCAAVMGSEDSLIQSLILGSSDIVLHQILADEVPLLLVDGANGRNSGRQVFDCRFSLLGLSLGIGNSLVAIGVHSIHGILDDVLNVVSSGQSSDGVVESLTRQTLQNAEIHAQLSSLLADDDLHGLFHGVCHAGGQTISQSGQFGTAVGATDNVDALVEPLDVIL